MFKDLIDEYNSLEPDGEDTWNPLKKERELWHRIRLLISLNWALKQMDIPVDKIKVLDVGCGVGRSTRALLEFGVKPENVVGIDLRISAIEYAKSVNPSISFYTINGFEDWPSPSTFDLCMQCTVFSSIDGYEKRSFVAEMMEKMIVDEGYIFWWDRIKANKFAGNDLLNPIVLFKNCSLVDQFYTSLNPSIKESINTENSIYLSLTKIVQKKLGHQKTHSVALFKKTKQ